MATKDKVITVKGDRAVVGYVEIGLKEDGQYHIVVAGQTVDDKGGRVQLEPIKMETTKSLAQIDELIAMLLTELRKANGLE